MRIFTIGHGARTAEELVAMLRDAGVKALVDVRRHPGSRRHPQFGQEALAAALASAGIEYGWLPALGGRRGKRDSAAPSRNPAWQVDAFRHYADYMDTPAFAAGLADLLAQAAARPTAIMCAERHPSQCHRRLIADALTVRGHEVVHLLDPARREVHRLPPFARAEGDAVRYDVEVDDHGQRTLL